MRKDLGLRKEEILKWIEDEKPKNYICKELKCKFTTLDSWLKKMNIEYKGKQNWSKGERFPEKWIPAINYLKKDFCVKSDTLKQKLFRDGLKEKKCEKCGIIKWNKVDAPLELHHIDGDRHNNELPNIKILCPNCHAQTSNYNRTKTIKKKKNYCKCGKEIRKESKNCPSCDKIKQRKVKDRPSKEELILMIKESSLEAVGRKYNVSGNAVKKWLKMAV